MHAFISVFFEQFLGEASILLAVITAIGYFLLKKPLSQIWAGVIKVVVGFRILQAGTHILVVTFKPVLMAFVGKYHVQGVFFSPEGAGLPAAQHALANHVFVNGEQILSAGSWVGYTLVLGFVLNILLVLARRVTKVQTIYVTGHLMFIHSVIATWLTHYVLGTGLGATVVISGVFLALYWGYASTVLLKPTNIITNNAGFSIGHQQMFGNWLAYKLAPFLGNPEDSIESSADRLPKWLKVFQDSVVAAGTIMFIFIGIIMLMLGIDTISAIKGLPGKNWVVKIILTSMSFPVALSIIMVGVKMFVAELQASFEGIRQKIIPGGAIAIDCAAIYGFSHPVVILFGFLFGAIGQFIGVALLAIFASPILALPGFIAMFFDNATIAVFANKFGGRRAVVIICTLSGLIQILAGAPMAYYSGLYNPEIAGVPGWINNFDFETVWAAFLGLLHLFS